MLKKNKSFQKLFSITILKNMNQTTHQLSFIHKNYSCKVLSLISKSIKEKSLKKIFYSYFFKRNIISFIQTNNTFDS